MTLRTCLSANDACNCNYEYRNNDLQQKQPLYTLLEVKISLVVKPLQSVESRCEMYILGCLQD